MQPEKRPRLPIMFCRNSALKQKTDKNQISRILNFVYSSELTDVFQTHILQ